MQRIVLLVTYFNSELNAELYSVGIGTAEAFIGFQPALTLLCFHTGLSSHISIIPTSDNVLFYIFPLLFVVPCWHSEFMEFCFELHFLLPEEKI